MNLRRWRATSDRAARPRHAFFTVGLEQIHHDIHRSARTAAHFAPSSEAQGKRHGSSNARKE
jgi:hypothetical protein